MKKSITKRLRLTPQEYEQIHTKMKEQGVSFSTFALYSMLKDKTPKKQKYLQQNKELVIELARWGNNLNQIARHLNTLKKGLDNVGLEMLKRIEMHLQELRTKCDC